MVVLLVVEIQFDIKCLILIHVFEKIYLLLNPEEYNLGLLLICQKKSNTGYALVVTKQKITTSGDGGSKLY